MNKNMNLLFAILLFSVNTMLAQKKTATDTIPAKLIDSSVDKYAKSLSLQIIHDLGLKNERELRSLRPAFQYKFFMIGLDDLIKYKSGDDVKTIIKELPAIEVALVDASGKIALGIGYVKQNNNWTVATFGLTPELSAVRSAQQIIGNNTLKKGSLIRIPGLETNFIAIPSPGGLNFIALKDDPTFGFKKGQIKPASDVITTLASSLKHYKRSSN